MSEAQLNCDIYAAAKDKEIERLRAELAAEREHRAALRECYDGFLKATGFKTLGDVEDVLGERDAARAELAAERESAEQYKRSHTDLHKLHCKAVAERDALRELLREALEVIGGKRSSDGFYARTDAALNGGGE